MEITVGEGAAAAAVAALLTGLIAAGCGPGERAARGPTVRDSAGVRIVENAPADTTETWSLGDRPVLEIGAVQGSVEYQLDGIADIARGPDGTLIVAERGSRELSVFDSAGRHVRTAGGEGGGPGEFRFVSELAWLPGDTLGAWDLRQNRLSLFTPAGAFLRARTLAPPADAVSLRLLGVLDSGDLVVGGSGSAGGGPSEGAFRRTVRLYRYGEGREPEARLDSVPGDERFRWSYRMDGRDAFLMMPQPFGSETSFAVKGDRVCSSPGARFEVRCRSADGRLRTIIRDSAGRRTVTGEAVERLVESRVEGIDRKEFRARVRRAHEEVEGVPDVMPALDRLLVDPEGRLWAGVYRPPYEEGARQWLVFGPAGVRRATVRMPGGFTPHTIDDGRVVGRWEGELGVDFVRVYRLRR